MGRAGNQRESAKGLRVRICSAKNGSSAGRGWELLEDALEDVQKNRHKKDPFQDKYLELLASSFAVNEQVRKTRKE